MLPLEKCGWALTSSARVLAQYFMWKRVALKTFWERVLVNSEIGKNKISKEVKRWYSYGKKVIICKEMKKCKGNPASVRVLLRSSRHTPKTGSICVCPEDGNSQVLYMKNKRGGTRNTKGDLILKGRKKINKCLKVVGQSCQRKRLKHSRREQGVEQEVAWRLHREGQIKRCDVIIWERCDVYAGRRRHLGR